MSHRIGMGRLALVGLVGMSVASAAASAQPYSIDWYTIDAGGGVSTGGSYTLSATIGQPDASGPQTGGTYTLTGGYWPGVAALQVSCLADFNNDGFVESGDIGAFVNAFLAREPSADVNGDGFIETADIQTFVTLFLAGC